MDPNETTTNLTETWVCWLIVCAFIGWMAQQPVLSAEEIEDHIITEATIMSSPSAMDIRPGETRLQAKRRMLAERRKVFEQGMAAAKSNNNADAVVSSPNWKKKLLAKSSSPPPSVAKTVDDSVSSSPRENVTLRSPLTSTTRKSLNDNNTADDNDDPMATYPSAPIPPPPAEPLSPIYFAFETNHKLSLQQRRQQLAERRRKFESRMMTVNQDNNVNNRSNSSGMGNTSPSTVQRKSATKPDEAAISSPVPLPSPSQDEDASGGITVPTPKDIQPTNLFPTSSTATSTSTSPTEAAASETTNTTSVADQRKVFEQGNVSNSNLGGSSSSIGHANNSRSRLDVVTPAVTTSPTPTKRAVVVQQRVSKLQQPRATPPGKATSRSQQVTPVSVKKQESTSTTPAKTTPSKQQPDSQEKGTPSKFGWMNRFGWSSPGKKRGSPGKSSSRKKSAAAAVDTDASSSSAALAKDPWDQYGAEQQQQEQEKTKSPKSPRARLKGVSLIPNFRKSPSSAKKTPVATPTKRETVALKPVNQQTPHKYQTSTPGSANSRASRIPPPKVLYSNPKVVVPPPGPFRPPSEKNETEEEKADTVIINEVPASPTKEEEPAIAARALAPRPSAPVAAVSGTREQEDHADVPMSPQSKSNKVVSMEEKFALLQQQQMEVVSPRATRPTIPDNETPLQRKRRELAEQRRDFETQMDEAKTKSAMVPSSTASGAGASGTNSDGVVGDDEIASDSTISTKNTEDFEDDLEDYQEEVEEELSVPPAPPQGDGVDQTSSMQEQQLQQVEKQQEYPPVELSSSSRSFGSKTSKTEAGSNNFEATLAQMRSALSPPSKSRKTVQVGSQDIPAQQETSETDRPGAVEPTPTTAAASVVAKETPLQAKRRKLAEQRRAFEERMEQAKKKIADGSASVGAAGPVSEGSSSVDESPATIEEPVQDRAVVMTGAISRSPSSSEDDEPDMQEKASQQEEQGPNNSFEATLQNVRSTLSPSGKVRKGVTSVPQERGLELPPVATEEEQVKETESDPYANETPLQRKRRQLAEQRKAFEEKMEQAKSNTAATVTNDSITTVAGALSDSKTALNSESAEEPVSSRVNESIESDDIEVELQQPLDDPVLSEAGSAKSSDLEEPAGNEEKEFEPEPEVAVAISPGSEESAIIEKEVPESEAADEEKELKLEPEGRPVASSELEESASPHEHEPEAFTTEPELEVEEAAPVEDEVPEPEVGPVNTALSEEPRSVVTVESGTEPTMKETPLQRKRRELAEQRKAFETKMEQAKSSVVSSGEDETLESPVEDRSKDSPSGKVVVVEQGIEAIETTFASVGEDDTIDEKATDAEERQEESNQEEEVVKVETPLERKRRELAERKQKLAERQQAKIREQEREEEAERARKKAEVEAELARKQAEEDRRAEAARMASLPRPPPPRPTSHFGFTVQKQEEEPDEDEGFSWNAWQEDNDALYIDDDYETKKGIAPAGVTDSSENVKESSASDFTAVTEPTTVVSDQVDVFTTKQQEEPQEEKNEHDGETPLQRKRRLLAEQRRTFETRMDQAKARSVPLVEEVASEQSAPAESENSALQAKEGISHDAEVSIKQDDREEEAVSPSTDNQLEEDRDAGIDQQEVSRLVQEVDGLASSLLKYEIELEDACRSLVHHVGEGEMKEPNEEEMWATGAPKSEFLDMYGKLVQQPWFQAHAQNHDEEGMPAAVDAASLAQDRDRGFRVTNIGKSFLENDGPAEADIFIFLHSFEGVAAGSETSSDGYGSMTLPNLEERWSEVARIAKTAQSKRIHDKLDELILFCLRANFIE